MKVKNWNLVNPAGGNGKLPAGGYVIRIDKVEDNDREEYLTIRYDVAEGEHANHYSDDYAKQNPYIHEFRRYYRDSASAYFAQFLQAIEASNPGFSIEAWSATCNPFELEGKLLGAVFQTRKYTNNQGEDKEALDFYEAKSVDAIRAGDFKVPPVNDKRTPVPGEVAPASTDSDADDDEPIPF